jgi:flavin reductase (DIM6/NTAB) family NADH-FMN oxidoreductase RutF
MVQTRTGHEIEEVMAQMPYGLYIVGSLGDGEPNGMMADWVMQVAFEPRMVAVSFENDAHTLENIRTDNVFTVNVLSQDKESMDLAAKFAQPYYGSKVKGRGGEELRVHHKLEEISYWESEQGCPILEGAMAWLECEAKTFIPVGDHTIVVGEVLDGRLERDAEPLTSAYTGWTYSG